MPFSNVPRDACLLVASGIVAALKATWAEPWEPRLKYTLHNAVASLLHCQNTSLICINRLLTDPSYLAWVVRQIDDLFLRDYWTKEFDGKCPPDR
jgi:hypothetical protein